MKLRYVNLKSMRGFTLIELMVVVALLAVLATWAMPSFRVMIANNKVASTASDLQNLLLFARSEAAHHRSQAGASLVGAKWQVKKSGGVIREFDLPNGVAAQGASSVNFQLNGTVAATAKVKLTADHANRQFCVEVTRSGLVRSKRQDVGEQC
ncbi:pilus assembly protein FimT [Vandammella animalimorsus]|uniref:Type II secretion system protein H n=1 Tax=Vandammella animalimorsus TaxID=2029117 RepID=A0A2A2ARI0_9BURK|nr:GspH/FimT family pseudopilin [Vandammella animalimorsus]PAT40363.1 pilus assembly protein FimT [Vandammella animalimorsus]